MKKTDKYFKTNLNKQKNFIEKELKKILNGIDAPKILKEVMIYSVLNGGKRIRPFIVAEVSSLYGVKPSIFKYPSMAVEMAHSFSLIYDDLPCMDDDDIRRGNPSVHIKFNEANALLGGASLLTYAYSILGSKNFYIEEKKKLLLLENFTSSIGHEGMLAGQFLDLEAESPKLKLSLNKLSKIQSKKTGLLIAFCCFVGGVLGNASEKELNTLYDFGMILGRIFQITDDILDKEGDEKTLGKKVNKDDAQNKATIIRAKGIKFAKNLLNEEVGLAKKKLFDLNKNTDILSDLVDYVYSRTS